MIDQIINQQSSAGVMSGNGNYMGQQYYGQSAGQNGQHSAEWQAYYAAQAVAKQQQPQQAPAPAPAAAAPAPAADAYYEQFFRYSYYYGEEAARQHYGAWSPPVGTPNPYGVNPNGITAAPAAAPSTPAPAPVAPQQNQEVRDTGRRGVSNLPAWMTRGK